MASYLSSYFGASTLTPTQSYPQSQSSGVQSTQSSGTWASSFSSRISGLRKALTKGSEEDDPDNEDCSHVSNVLRAYYTEKGRPFPEWLPPDPTKPVVQVQQPASQYGNLYSGHHGMNSNNIQNTTHSRASSGGRAGLSDLWDPTPIQSASHAQSLRASRNAPQSYRSTDAPDGDFGSNPHASRPTMGPRPMLSSQRSGSSQRTLGNTPSQTTLGSRDRLRARLQGSNSGRNSPANLPPADSYSSGGVSDQRQDNSEYIAPARAYRAEDSQQSYASRFGSGPDTYDPYSYQQRPR